MILNHEHILSTHRYPYHGDLDMCDEDSQSKNELKMHGTRRAFIPLTAVSAERATRRSETETHSLSKFPVELILLPESTFRANPVQQM